MANLLGKGLTGHEMRRVQRQLRLTRWALRAEHVARAFWPLFTVVCLTVATALLGGFEALGPIAHRILLGIAGIALVATLVLAGTKLRRPTRDEVESRLDTSHPHRPLAVLRDELAVGRGASETETVWHAYRHRARLSASALQARWPDLRLSGRDRWALRLLAPALMIGGLIATGGNWPDRLAAMTEPAPVTPATDSALMNREATAEAWAVPPGYTGLATIYLERQAADDDPVKVPRGSRITIRVTDLEGLPTIAGGALAGIEEFASLGGGLAEATGVLTGSGALEIRAGEERLAGWRIEMIPDTAPEIELVEPPSATLTRALSLTYQARDDYGVMTAWAVIAPEGHDPENARGLPLPVISMGLPLPITGESRDVNDRSIRDFTAHPWAGADVVIKLHAEDGAEQRASSEPLTFRLPERIFTVPLARALVEQRRDLALDYGRADRVLDVLQAVTRKPEGLFDDPGVFLTVRTAIRRLAGAIGTETVPDTAPDVIELLWYAALALEDGDLSSALERLRQAQEALREALENGTEEDIRRAMEKLRAAMNEYLQQLAEQQRQNPRQGPEMDPSQMLSQQDLQDMLDELQRQAEGGMRDQARDMLSQLNRLLENLQAGRQNQQQGQGQRTMRELQDLIQRQRDLSDQTFDQLRQRRREQQRGQGGSQPRPGQRGQQPGEGQGQGRGRGNQPGQPGQPGEGERGMPGGRPGSGGLAAQQEALRRQLEALSRGVGSDAAARALEEAIRAMGEARNDLRQGQNSDAVRDQMDALDSLNEGAEALAQEIQDGQGDTAARGNRRGRRGAGDSETEDPFDRPTSSFGAIDGRATKVPDQALIDRARELMEELRRRAAEPSRPQLELDYLDRLMGRF